MSNGTKRRTSPFIRIAVVSLSVFCVLITIEKLWNLYDSSNDTDILNTNSFGVKMLNLNKIDDKNNKIHLISTPKVDESLNIVASKIQTEIKNETAPYISANTPQKCNLGTEISYRKSDKLNGRQGQSFTLPRITIKTIINVYYILYFTNYVTKDYYGAKMWLRSTEWRLGEVGVA
jgi:hypothetical protein